MAASPALSSCGLLQRSKTIGFVASSDKDTYSLAAMQGAQEAASELRLDVQCLGPPGGDTAGQIAIVDRLVAEKVAAISISPLDRDALAPALLRARQKGVKVNTWDADTRREAREVYLSQSDAQLLGETIADLMVRTIGRRGEVVLVTGSARYMAAWAQIIKDRAASQYPELVIKATLNGESDGAKGVALLLQYLPANPQTRGVFVVDEVAAVSAAEAIKQLGLPPGKIAVVGIGLPNKIRPYVKSGIIQDAVLWSPVDLGYAAIYITKAQLKGTLSPARMGVGAGRLGLLRFTSKDEVLLGPPTIFNQSNIDTFNF